MHFPAGGAGPGGGGGSGGGGGAGGVGGGSGGAADAELTTNSAESCGPCSKRHTTRRQHQRAPATTADEG